MTVWVDLQVGQAGMEIKPESVFTPLSLHIRHYLKSISQSFFS
ncbi:protein of unknown function [Limnospira indica PCC 8005]|uniref:Uncharacterized protein n=1 Tax=Limnospira indica PCC 8005 TaxID=376219 RepID=A0A9P1KHL9_9CYAN|nr:protein of unknown function [Limnospira indica PCC 8005]